MDSPPPSLDLAGLSLEDADEPLQQPATGLGELEPDAFAAVCSHLSTRDVASLAASSSCLAHAVSSNDRLFSALYRRAFPEPWRRLTAPASPASVAPGAWRETYLRTHDACQQLRSTEPVCREWTTDATAVHMASIYGAGPERLTVTAQGSGVELQCSPELGVPKSIQLYGHTGRVAAVRVLPPAANATSALCLRIITASHDQTVR